MTERYRLDAAGVWISKATGKPMETGPDFVPSPAVISDVEYMSPLSRKLVTSRSQRRDEMARHNVREVDPSEHKPTYRNKKNAIANRGEWNPDAGTPKWASEEAAPYQRLSRNDLPAKLAKSIEKRA